MQSSPMWRELLGVVLKDAQVKNRVANELGVSSLTLTRWVSGVSRPRLQNLRVLLHALPEYRQQFLELIRQDFGSSMAEAVDVDVLPHTIPSIFYTRVMRAHCTLPRILHFSSICDIILQQALGQLDPNRAGLQITVVQCMYPTPENKIRTLHESLHYSTFSYDNVLEAHTVFLGSESLAGAAISSGKAQIVLSRQEGMEQFPDHWKSWEESVMAYPILISGRVAGCLLFSSTLPDYFRLTSRQNVIQLYTDLISVAFEPTAFYELDQIELARMPTYDVQCRYLVSLRQRIAEVMRKPQFDIFQAERQVLQQIEDELLQRFSY